MAETLRVATYNTELSRPGPGLLLRDIRAGDDPQITAVLAEIVQVNADVIALQGIDIDLENTTLRALNQALNDLGLTYPYLYAAPTNAGRRTALDMDGDGGLGGAGDAQGWGRFYGDGAMAVLSRYPIDEAGVQDFTGFLWKDLPDALLPQVDDQLFPSQEALDVQRLPSKGAWVVPVAHPSFGRVTLFTFDAGPPVFDGPEDRNGRRNHDEIMFWSHYLQGGLGAAPNQTFVLLGNANLDPIQGEGRHDAIQHLLDHPLLQDPLPDQTTVSWDRVGKLRVGYVLPSRDWRVVGAEVRPANPAASRHQLIYVDLAR